jgi:transcriptional regulator with XRE-family HTH domain
MKINSEKIRKELVRKGWTLGGFAQALNMTRQGFGQVLSREHTTFKTLDKIAALLEYDAKDLLT